MSTFCGLNQNGVQKLTAGTGASTAPIKDSRPAAKPITPEYRSKPQLTTDIPELRCAGCGCLMRAAGDKKNFDINQGGKTSGFLSLPDPQRLRFPRCLRRQAGDGSRPSPA